MPHILYSSFICVLIITLIKYFSLTEKDFILLKNLDKKNINEKVTEILKCIKIKLVLFFILNFLFIIFFWYYLSCFCAVYKNSQIHLIKDTLICFGISMLYPFGYNLITSLLRILSLRSKNKDKECLFKFSKFLQIF